MVSVAHQSLPDFLNMQLVARLQRHGHDAGVDLGLRVLALVGDIQHVRSGVCDAGQQLGQVARLVGQLGLELDNAPGLLQALGDDAMRPVFCRPLVMMRERVVMSTLPPETTTAVFREVSTFSKR